jgi:hypothetical protein
MATRENVPTDSWTTPREAYLERKVALLERELEALKRYSSMDRFGPISSDPASMPAVMDLPEPTTYLKVAEGEIYHGKIMTRTMLPGNNAAYGYMLDQTLLDQSIDPVRLIAHLYERIFLDLSHTYEKRR